MSSVEETITAIEGGSVTLDCEADKNFETCTFMFNGEPVLMDDYISGEGTTKCSLELNDLRMLEDNGVFTCSLKFQNIERQRSIIVNVSATSNMHLHFLALATVALKWHAMDVSFYEQFLDPKGATNQRE